jgi:hypothetical protein
LHDQLIKAALPGAEVIFRSACGAETGYGTDSAAATDRGTVSVIGEGGFSNTTVSRISRRAGVSAGILHHCFGGKIELLVDRASDST